MNRIAGIFDLARSGGSLGTLLILLEELEIQRRIHSAAAVDVILVDDARWLAEPAKGAPAFAGTASSRGAGMSSMTALAAVAGAMSGVTGCLACRDAKALDEAMRLIRSGCVLWPGLGQILRGGHAYDSTAAIREFHARTGSIPRLSVSAGRLAWAKRYLDEKAGGRLAVAVHLKNHPGITGQSNADLTSWYAFIRANARRAHFVLIGDDATNAEFRRLPNTTVARDEGIAIDGYLALIQGAGLFMGMMSGPANMALFGSNPYLIFKHPDHHAEAMALELGDADRYSFALPDQRVLRIWDTEENLAAAFESVMREVTA